MDSEKLQFPGVKASIKETYKVLAQWRKIFALVTVVFIFPFSLFVLSYLKLLEIISAKIHSDFKNNTLMASHLLNLVLINLGYLVLGFIFTLLSTSAIVYPIACSFTSKDLSNLSFRKVVSAVPKLLKTFRKTLLLSVVVFQLFSRILLILSLQSIWNIIEDTRYGILVLLVSLYVVAFILCSIQQFHWNLTCIMWVLLDICGIPIQENHVNLRRYQQLTQGKVWIGALISATLQMVTFITQVCFYGLLTHGKPLVIPGIACFIFLSTSLLISIVFPTMVYCISVPRNVDGTIASVYFYV
ncbi:hypothetical protein ACHQM5_024378 [Ranunculus cassubicifolius]